MFLTYYKTVSKFFYNYRRVILSIIIATVVTLSNYYVYDFLRNSCNCQNVYSSNIVTNHQITPGSL